MQVVVQGLTQRVKDMLKVQGNFAKLSKWLKERKELYYDKIYQKYGEMGVQALSAATPVDTGLTASSWNYRVIKEPGRVTIEWFNTNEVNNGRYTVNVAVLIQYGHATVNGGFVSGYDYINPAMKPIFEKMADSVWKEVRELK